MMAAATIVGVFAIVSFLLAWHGDALETDRHRLSAGVQLRLALWIVTFVTLDLIASRVRSRSQRFSSLTA